MDPSNLASKNEETENSSTTTNNIVETSSTITNNIVENSFTTTNNIVENSSTITNNIVENSSIITNNIVENLSILINNIINNVDVDVDVDVDTNINILPIGENVESDDAFENEIENNLNVVSTLNENITYSDVNSDDEHYDDEHDVEDHNVQYEGYFNQLPQLFIPANIAGTSFFSIPILENLNNPQGLFNMMVNNMLNPVMATNIVNEINPSNSGNSVLQNTSFTGQPLNLNMNSVGNQGMIEEEVRKLILYGEENLNLVTQPVLDFIESCYLQNMQYDENLINLIHYTVKNVFARNTQFEMKELISGIIVYSLNGINATFSDNYDMVLPILEQEIKSIVTRSLRLAILRRTMAVPEMEDVKLVVGADALEKIPICKYENLEDKIKKMNISCTVCQNDFNTEDSVRLLPCSHIYHPDCIDDWLKGHSYKCPCCRKPAAEHSAKI